MRKILRHLQGAAECPTNGSPLPAKHAVTEAPQATTTRVGASARAPRGGGDTPLRVGHPRPGHPAQAAPTVANAPWLPAGGAGTPASAAQQGF
jgi:hypothetical protein